MVKITISDLYHIPDKSLLDEPTPREMNTIVGGYRQKNTKYKDVAAEFYQKFDKTIDKWLEQIDKKMAAWQDNLDV